MRNENLITVCADCLKACCWQGIYMCETSFNADIMYKTKEELEKLNLEHPQYWEMD